MWPMPSSTDGLRDAFRGIGPGTISLGSGADAGADCGRHRTAPNQAQLPQDPEHPIFCEIREVDHIASSVSAIVSQNDTVAAILAPTDSGLTARRLARYKLPTWILAVSANKQTCRELLFSSGVLPFYELSHPADWSDYARKHARQYRLKGSCIIQTEGPSPENPQRNHKMEIIDLREIR